MVSMPIWFSVFNDDDEAADIDDDNKDVDDDVMIALGIFDTTLNPSQVYRCTLNKDVIVPPILGGTPKPGTEQVQQR